MQRFISATILFLMLVTACRQPDVAPSLLATEITPTESLRPFSLDSKVVDSHLVMTIAPQGPVVCCCVPCPQASYNVTARYEVQVAASEAGPYQTYLTINVGRDEQQQYAPLTVALPDNASQQLTVVRVVAVADNGRAGYVQAVMNSAAPATSSVGEVVLPEQGTVSGINFSQNKAQIAYATYVQDASLALIPTLYLADYAQGQFSNRRVLTPGGFGGEFSQNGKQLAYFLPYQPTRQTLMIYDIAAQTYRSIDLLSGRSLGSLTWSPDGQWLAFVEQNNSYCRLWKVNVATGKEEAVTAAVPYSQTGALWQSTIDWSPDGRAVAVTRRNDSLNRIQIGISLVSPTDGSLLTDLNTLVGCQDKNPAYSADGQRIAFISTRTSTLSTVYTLWTRTLATNQLQYIRLPDSYQLSDYPAPKWVGTNALLISAYTGTPRKQRSFIVSL